MDYISRQNLFAVSAVYIIYWLIFGRKSRYYWSSAWKAFALSIPTFMGTIVGLVEVYRFFIIYVILKVTQQDSEIALFPLFVFLVFSLIIHVVIVGLYSAIAKGISSNPPVWLVPRNWGTIFSSFMVTTLATSIPAIIFIPLFISYRRPIAEIFTYTGSRSSEFVSIAYTLWFFSALWIYHALDILKDYLRKHIKKSPNKSKPETPKSKIDPIDRDLINLKHKTGIHFKDTPKK